MEAGIDVLIEKPVAPDLPSAECLVRCADRHGGSCRLVTWSATTRDYGSREGCHAAVVLRDSSPERVHAPQPGRGCCA